VITPNHVLHGHLDPDWDQLQIGNPPAARIDLSKGAEHRVSLTDYETLVFAMRETAISALTNGHSVIVAESSLAANVSERASSSRGYRALKYWLTRYIITPEQTELRSLERAKLLEFTYRIREHIDERCRMMDRLAASEPRTPSGQRAIRRWTDLDPATRLAHSFEPVTILAEGQITSQAIAESGIGSTVQQYGWRVGIHLISFNLRVHG
jgi:hypothetical protein